MHDGLGEEIHRLVQIGWRAFLEMVAAFEVEILSLGAGRRRSSQRTLVPGFTMAERKGEERARDQNQGQKQQKSSGRRRRGWRQNKTKIGRREHRRELDGEHIDGDGSAPIAVGRRRYCGSDVDGLPVMVRSLQPFCQLVGVSKDAAADTSRHAVHRKPAFFFPTFDCALVAIKEGGNFLPGI